MVKGIEERRSLSLVRASLLPLIRVLLLTTLILSFPLLLSLQILLDCIIGDPGTTMFNGDGASGDMDAVVWPTEDAVPWLRAWRGGDREEKPLRFVMEEVLLLGAAVGIEMV